jgi:Tfp pilus assembly protein PilN
MDFNFLGICGGIAVALAVGLISGVWVVGIVLGVAVAVSTAERMRRRAALTQQQAPIEAGRRKRKG